jgi:hypothetical protein
MDREDGEGMDENGWRNALSGDPPPIGGWVAVWVVAPETPKGGFARRVELLDEHFIEEGDPLPRYRVYWHTDTNQRKVFGHYKYWRFVEWGTAGCLVLPPPVEYAKPDAPPLYNDC